MAAQGAALAAGQPIPASARSAASTAVRAAPDDRRRSRGGAATAGAATRGRPAAAGAGGAAARTAAPTAGRSERRRGGRGVRRTRPAPKDGGQLTPLVYAARANDLDSVKVLLAAGADVNQTTGYGWSPLLVATQNRYYKLGAYLLEHGANPNLANKGGWVPLYLATDNRNIENGDYPVRKGDMDHLEFIKLLLDKGAERQRARQGQHRNAHGVHQPVARRERRDGVPARVAVRRSSS